MKKFLLAIGCFLLLAAVASSIPFLARAMLTTGVVDPDHRVTIDLAHPLEVKEGFIGRDHDFTPFYFKDPKALGRQVLKGIASGQIQNLFIAPFSLRFSLIVSTPSFNLSKR